VVVSILQVVQVYISWKSVSFAPIRQLVGVQRVSTGPPNPVDVSSYYLGPFWISIHSHVLIVVTFQILMEHIIAVSC